MDTPRRRAARAALAALTAGALLAGCGSAPPRPTFVAATPAAATTGPAAPAPPAAGTGPAADRAAALSDADLVGQVLMPFAYGADATDVTPASAAANRALAGVATPAELVARYRLGGVILVGATGDDPTAASQPTSNVDSPAAVRRLTAGLQRAGRALPAAAPLLVGTDQEYGTVVRIRDGVTALPSAMAFGAADRPAATTAAWRAAGTELSALGVNVAFAPVADVVGGADGVIGSRSYGSRPAAVSEQVGAAVRGLRAGGVAATLKHFPGHGHTAVDSHAALPRLARPLATLEREDLPPFRAGIAAGAELVMAGHLDVAAVDPGTPATFSKPVLTGLLRGKLGYDGVVVTDALNMAPAKRWPPAEAALRALLAGNDLLLMPLDLPAVQRGLLAALRDGRLPRAQLVASVARILRLKQRYADRPAPGTGVLRAPAHAAAADAVSRAALTQLRGPCGGPLVDGPVAVTAARGRERRAAALRAALADLGVPVAADGTPVHLVGYGDGPADLNPDAAVTIALDSPRVLAAARSPVLLAAYAGTPGALRAAAAVLAGRAPAPGRSPVAVEGLPRTSCPG
ncbi:beta-N-acetylhexosaminidase [Pilimelia anulata]|uniref:beta-N-acetylhexosaminidase n=1 Tax=Pilimelia anulata TaxID=53371 RepID=A0A8J3F782_9ACTN|nr:glycoside hydrolase family 3 N-terminal domain-containing protein [Pilimelia anulata]GGJ76253.1 beta-N-acetylhexosaminidase [Pilimelia anulata]